MRAAAALALAELLAVEGAATGAAAREAGAVGGGGADAVRGRGGGGRSLGGAVGQSGRGVRPCLLAGRGRCAG